MNSFDLSSFNATSEIANQGGPSHTRVKFYNEPVFQSFESEKQGRKIYKDEVFIRFSLPGGDVHCRKARPRDIERFQEKYDAFVRQEKQVDNGTRIEAFNHPLMSPARIHTLRAKEIYTLEDIRDYPASDIDDLGKQGLKLQQAVRSYLDDSSSNETLLAKIKELEAKLEEKQEKPKSKPKKK